MKDMLVDGDGRSLLGPSGLGHGARDPSGAFINGVAAVSETGRVLGCARTLRELSSMPDVRARGTPDTGITATCTPGLARAWAERGGGAVALSVDAPFMCLAGEELKGFGDIGAARFDDADSQCVQLRPPRNLRFGESRRAREGMLEATLDWARMRWPTRQPEGFVAAGCVELHFPQTGDFDGPGRSAQQLYADWMDEMDMIWPRSSHACAVVDAPEARRRLGLHDHGCARLPVDARVKGIVMMDMAVRRGLPDEAALLALAGCDKVPGGHAWGLLMPSIKGEWVDIIAGGRSIGEAEADAVKRLGIAGQWPLQLFAEDTPGGMRGYSLPELVTRKYLDNTICPVHHDALARFQASGARAVELERSDVPVDILQDRDTMRERQHATHDMGR